jgi:hypothetical protein
LVDDEKIRDLNLGTLSLYGGKGNMSSKSSAPSAVLLFTLQPVLSPFLSEREVAAGGPKIAPVSRNDIIANSEEVCYNDQRRVDDLCRGTRVFL